MSHVITASQSINTSFHVTQEQKVENKWEFVDLKINK